MIAEIIALLKTSVPALRTVEGAAGFQRATDSNPAATPAAYVFLVEEEAAEGSLDSPMIQQIVATLSTVLVVRNVGDVAGAGATTDMDTLREQVRTALLGKLIDTDHDPLSIIKSSLIAFRDGHMWWQMTWSTAYYVVATT